MRTFDFNNGFVTESQQINEFLGAMLVAGALGFMVTKGTLNIFSSIQKTREEILKSRLEQAKTKDEMAKRKAEQEADKAAKKAAKKQEKLLKKQLKLSYAWENSILSMPDGPEKEKMLQQADAQHRLLQGRANASDMKLLEDSTKTEPAGLDQIQGKIENSTNGIPDDVFNNWLKKNGIDPDPEKIAEAFGKSAKQIENTKQETEPEPEPEKTDGEETKTEPEKTDGEETKTEPEPEEDDPQSDDERIDNDDDIEDLDYSSKEDLQKDPKTKYKRRTYKRGNKTFKTKSYYDKKGNSISKEDFEKMEQAYQERQSKKNKKTKTNESFGTFKFTRIGLNYITESNDSSVQTSKPATNREGICKERLVYLQYVMDTTTNSVEKVKMERMYNSIYNLTFNSKGELRSLGDLFTYLNETMKENAGKIPGLPNNEQIINIDEKVKAFKELYPEKFDSYLARLDKTNLDKSKNDKDDMAKDILSKKQPKDDSDALKEIQEISNIPGLTNILGLEPDRKMSNDDIQKQKEVEKQKHDGTAKAETPNDKNIKPEDVSQEDIDKIVKGEVKEK